MQPAGSNKSIPLADSRIIAQAFAMRRVVQTPRDDAPKPLIPGALAYGSALRDRRGRWRMWYLADPVYCEYFATSTDGRRWAFPRLDLVTPKIRPLLAGPNAFLCRQQKDAKGRWLAGENGPEGFAVLDAEETPHPAAKARFTALYLARAGTEAGLYAAHSDDGVRWFADTGRPAIAGWRDTSSSFFYDPRIRKYVWYGRPGAYAAMNMHANRLIARRESEDLTHWTPDLTVLDTDDADADSHLLLDEAALRAGKSAASARERAAAWEALTEGERAGQTTMLVRGRARQWYGITVFPCAGFYLGLAWLYDLPTGEIWPELVRSADGIQWQREPARTAFIPRIPGAIIFTMASPPVATGDEIRVYYSVNNRNHHGVPNPRVAKGIRVAALKRDRWVGYVAGESQGELLTQVIQKPRRLALNASSARDGWARVEVTDADGCPLAGFTKDECEPITGDGLDIVPRWRSGNTIARLRANDIRLRIHAHRASIFALNF